MKSSKQTPAQISHAFKFIKTFINERKQGTEGGYQITRHITFRTTSRESDSYGFKQFEKTLQFPEICE